MPYLKPYLVIYHIENVVFGSKLVTAENEKDAQERFEQENPTATVTSVRLYTVW